MRPFTGDQPLIYWLLDDPAIAAQYRNIVREIGTSVFTSNELSKLVDALEAVGSGRGPSPRDFIAARTAADTATDRQLGRQVGPPVCRDGDLGIVAPEYGDITTATSHWRKPALAVELDFRLAKRPESCR
jgi:hypothetical protein